MVSPVTGPFSRVVDKATFYSNRDVWKQAKPIDRPLPFTGRYADRRFAIGQQEFFLSLANDASLAQLLPSSAVKNAAMLAAYERFRGQISDKAQLGVFLFELEQAAGMIATRGKQLLDLIRAARKFDFRSISRILKKDFKSSPSKGFAGIWLELNFGWLPMIWDIHSAVDVLQNPIKAINPVGSALGGYTRGMTTSGTFPDPASRQSWDFATHGKVGAAVEVSNPNLFLANNLGLVNPGTIAWELIPFSFVVDWFIPVEAFLSYGTDLYGLSVTNAWSTLYTRGTVYNYTKQSFIARYGERYTWCGYVNRSLGLPGPSLFVRPYKIPSWRRAGHAISLVVQNLKGK